ncbi:MAG: GT4 family glycosyltransferase PelF [Pseudomonadota bacterium]|nr:GT4 family glycosyltransferase PelF [Pseudomonadota bacterium]
MIESFDHRPGREVDVAIIVEGCYPHVSGGVSTWIDWLLRNSTDHSFAVTSIVAPLGERRSRYDFPENLVRFEELVLGKGAPKPFLDWRRRNFDANDVAMRLVSFLTNGTLRDLENLEAVVNDTARPLPFNTLMRGRCGWELCAATYRELMPHASFRDYFWAYQALVGGLFAVMKARVPKAKVCHTISTGYAGLMAARARIAGFPSVILTEHGVYTNERRIEILMSEWIASNVDRGLADDKSRNDLRDFWIMAFESYARACYEASSSITTLFGDNQSMQRLLGAPENRLQVIANGIDVERFSAIPQPPNDAPLTVALIGRVVPIKDIKTFLGAARRIANAMQGVRILIAGSMDEDPGYAAECLAMCSSFGLNGIVEFLGQVDVRKLIAQTHVVVLTSLSEAQPLTVLEAGAAKRPCVTTDVGACREMIEVPGEEGGFVADLLDADQVGDAVVRLLKDEALRRTFGENLSRRVERLYTSEISASHYHALYNIAPIVESQVA